MPPRSRLNVFQRLTRHWDAMHPYNAAQVMRLGIHLHAETAERLWRQTVHAAGLGRAIVDGDGYRYEPLSDADPPQVILPTGVSLDSHLSAEMNRPFAAGDVPFRPFLMHDDNVATFGVVYHHWAADSFSIRLLLQRMLEAILDPSVRHAPLRHPAGGYWKHFGPDAAGWNLDEGLLTGLRWSSRMRRLRRIESPEFDRYATRSMVVRAPDGLIARVVSAARRMDATANDVFLAAIAEVCNSHGIVTPARFRRDVALGTIVDLRGHCPRDLSDTFGLFLGFDNVILRPRDLDHFPTLVRAIADQSKRQKRSASSCSSMLRMTAGLVAHRMFSRRKVATFYRKRLPLAGGISNVNLNRTFAAAIDPAVLREFIRISPAGPMMPLVFTTTTLRESMNFGFTWREAIMTEEVARQCCRKFVERIESIAD